MRLLKGSVYLTTLMSHGQYNFEYFLAILRIPIALGRRWESRWSCVSNLMLMQRELSLLLTGLLQLFVMQSFASCFTLWCSNILDVLEDEFYTEIRWATSMAKEVMYSRLVLLVQILPISYFLLRMFSWYFRHNFKMNK